MRFHHICILVSDMDAAIKLWRDVMGFKVVADTYIPDGEEPGPSVFIYPKLLEDIFGVKGARSRMVMLASPEGAMIELEQPEVPKIQKTPPENLRYEHTGIHEICLLITDIDSWFKKIQTAGYKTQTEYVWDCADTGRSFLFYDQDDNLIQLWERPKRV